MWVIAAVALAVGEALTLGFFLGAVAVAAVVAAVFAVAGLGLVWQLLAFVVGAVASVLFLRPIARRHIHTPAQLRTGTAALVGSRAVVLERVDVDGGRVKIGGEVWSARSYFDEQVIQPGARVEVAKIEGATALVYE